MTPQFAKIGQEFINLYTEENPILDNGQICYFLTTNLIDIHRPLICKGQIIEGKFTDGLNKAYFIKPIEILETPKIQEEFLYRKPIFIHFYVDNNIATNKKFTQVKNFEEYKKHLIEVQSFFIRNSLQQIRQLRIDYISVLKKDIQKQLSDIDNI